MSSKPVLVLYHVPSDQDEADIPNAFPVLAKGHEGVKLQDVRAKFPLPGTYHFRFKMKWGESAGVWMDVTNEDSPVPMWNGQVIAKVTRISWDKVALPKPGSATAAAAPKNGAARAPPQAAAPPPAQAAAAPARPAAVSRSATAPSSVNVVDGALVFDDDAFGGYGAASPPQPASRNQTPSPPPKDDFDMLFG
eukprot:TRINITY_DN124753_c0_g1_i1.p1 TRINITY_DN124753_c0_g1~~TRINITY_DN124753_c0_g1_i1.p1  ORF type:complete len:193 (+),score=48.07 TRINITY_DN124753_c0_g1_i1:94-672(+)